MLETAELFRVSVVTPVYNAEKFLIKAVQSAVNLRDVGEVILIEDNSLDDSLRLCRDLENKFDKVKLFRHPNGENRGAGASRNLGMKNSTCEFIAFLDADDWYLPNRFEQTKKMFKNSSVDGVYEPIGTWFYDKEGSLFGKKISKEKGDQIVTFLKKKVEPNDLFYSLLSQENGNFSTDGITLRKSLVSKVGNFSSSLRLHQDTEYWIRCAYYGKLVSPPNPNIVAIRGVHAENRINNVSFNSKAKFYESLFKKIPRENLSLKERILLYKKYILFNTNRNFHGGAFHKKYPELFKIFLKTLYS